MRRIIKYSLVTILLFFVSGVSSFAQSPTATSTSSQPETTGLQYLINGADPTEADITGLDPFVEIQFYGLENASDNKFWICNSSDQTACRLKPYLLKPFTLDVKKSIIAKVCGGGKDSLKGAFTDGGFGKACKDGSDYFHEGYAYSLGIYDDKGGENQIMVAEFLVRHSVPQVKLVSSGNKINVTLSGRRPGKDNMNNYEVVLEGTNNTFKEDICRTVPKGTLTVKQGSQTDFLNISLSGGVIASFPKDPKKNSVFPGQYRLKINERINEGGLHTNDCQGGFTYLHVDFTLHPDGKITVNRYEFDPNESDYNKINKIFKIPSIPCAHPIKAGQPCTKLNTAIGDINIEPQALVKSIFSIIFSVAGVGALIIIVYGGYLFMTSRGDKEKVAAARETITSAILGLLFIIFSIVILETIGVDILRIPGLTK